MQHSSFIWIFLIIVIFVVLFIIKNVKINHDRPKQDNVVPLNNKIIRKYKAKAIMTDNEIEFFQRLIKSFPKYYIFPQVSLGAILVSADTDPSQRHGTRMTFSQKMADYVICNQQMKIVAIVELDDKTHSKEKDDKRDNMLSEAGYKIFRFESKNKPSIEELSKLLPN